MAKDKKKAPLGKVGRVEREERLNKIIKYGTILVVGFVISILLGGIIIEGFIRPNQPVAIVAGKDILGKEFQTRVRFERAQLINQYYNYYQTMQLFVNNPDLAGQYQYLLQQIQYQLEPAFIGLTTIDIMVDEIIISNEAKARGIEVTEGEVEEIFETSFGYLPDGVQEPTMTPTIIPASTLSATQLSLVTITPTPTTPPTITPDPESDQAATQIPTFDSASPTPEPFTLEDYQTGLQEFFDYYESEYKITESEIRAIYEARLYRQKLMELITADLPAEEEQVWARHILVEDEDTAREVVSLLEDGEDWAELAQAYSTDESNAGSGGNLGWFSASTMINEFSEVAFNTPIGSISDPVQTTFGWHIIQVLGHEMRPLTPAEHLQLKEAEFINWLSQARLTIEYEIKDYLEDIVPEEPSIPYQLRMP